MNPSEVKWSNLILIKSGAVIVAKDENGNKRKFLLDEDLKVRINNKDNINILFKNSEENSNGQLLEPNKLG